MSLTASSRNPETSATIVVGPLPTVCQTLVGPNRATSAIVFASGTSAFGNPGPIPAGVDGTPPLATEPDGPIVIDWPACTNTPVFTGTVPPVLAGPSSKLSLSRPPAVAGTSTTTPVTWNGADVAGAKPGAATFATSVYGVPTLSTARNGNVAMPLPSVTADAPLSTAPVGLLPSDS